MRHARLLMYTVDLPRRTKGAACMIDPSRHLPSEADAAQLALKLLSVQPRQVTRFRTGGAHYVYDVTLADQQHVVVRMAATSPASLHGAVYWAHRLRPFTIPLPAIL